MLTARQIKDVSLGEWNRYFGWRIHPKRSHLPIIAVVLAIMSISILILVSVALPNKTLPIQVIASDSGIVRLKSHNMDS